MGTTTSSSLSVLSRSAIVVVAVVVVLIPIFGFRLFGGTPEKIGTTGSVTLNSGHRLLFVTAERLAVMPLTANTGATVSDLECTQVYAAAGTGLCLRKATAVAWAATVLDRRLTHLGSYPVEGTPSLARLSPSGRMAAWTSFVAGTSFASGSATTQTTLLDTKSGTILYPVEFKATVDGKSVKGNASKRQVWGVTFADDNRFYATLVVDGTRWLVAGDIGKHTLRSLAKDVALPSLSPDGKSIAFLRKNCGSDGGSSGPWRLCVMRLDNLRVAAMADSRAIEDQPIWLDDRTLAYTVRSRDGSPSIWAVPADGSGRPSLLRDSAESPAPL